MDSLKTRYNPHEKFNVNCGLEAIHGKLYRRYHENTGKKHTRTAQVTGKHPSRPTLSPQGSGKPFNQKTKIMDQNNLLHLKQEMRTLGFREDLTVQMEKNMEANLPEFTLKDKVEGVKSELELNIYFRQSSQSEFYYLNKFEVLKAEERPLVQGETYRVSVDGASGQLVQNFETAFEAVGFFRAQGEPTTLAIAKGNDIQPLVTVRDGQVILIEKDFAKTFRSPEMPQTFWVDRGKGFAADQAVNLVEGRSVYRDDMLTQGGQEYKAWFKMDLDGPRDKYQNFTMNQYHDPSYGFNLSEVLDKFAIKELDSPKSREVLENALKNGDRAPATVEKDGQKIKVYIEAVPRYTQINMFTDQGKSEKREQFLKDPAKVKEMLQSKGKEKGASTEQGMGI
ncbi:hypothetical protein ACFOG5_02225 [Pedobacter fastidiosus]|uniref:hypothetical protein n=1 Tax=Pedobacter fastidiosus TaxID=2765361 RepID=UPI00360BC414